AHAARGAEIGRLRQIGDARAGLHEAAALVELELAGQRLQQRRLAAAVAADQAHAVAAAERDVDAGEQRRAAEAEPGAGERDQGRAHAIFRSTRTVSQAAVIAATFWVARTIASAGMPAPISRSGWCSNIRRR